MKDYNQTNHQTASVSAEGGEEKKSTIHARKLAKSTNTYLQ